MAWTTRTAKNTPQQPLDLLREVEKFNPYRVIGVIVPGDTIGQLLRMGLVDCTHQCTPDCWAHHCPFPEQHVRLFRLTVAGRAAFIHSNQGTP